MGSLTARPGLVLLLALAACARLPDAGRIGDEAGLVEVPSEFRGGHVLVATVLAERDTAWLVLDSGAQLVVLDRALADRFGVDVIGRSRLTGYGSDTVRGSVARELLIGPPGTQPFPLNVPVVDLSGVRPYAGYDVNGFLGVPFLSRYVVEIDYARERVVLHAPDSFRPHPGDVSLELDVRDGVPFVDGTIELADGGELSGRFVLDTGMRNAVSLATPFVVRHGLVQRMGPTVSTRIAGLGGVSDFRVGRVEAIAFGRVRVPRPPVEFDPEGAGIAGSDDYAGAIGSALLRRFVVTVDLRRERLYLRDTGAADSIEVDMSGASFVATGADLRTLVVDRVDEGSAAQRAGLEAGDILLDIDGRTASDLPLWELRDMLRSGAGRRLPMAVQRDGETLRLELVLERRI